MHGNRNPRAGMMRAFVQDRYGSPDVLELREIDKPTVGDGQVRVRVHAASVCKGDWHVLTGKPYLIRLMMGLRRPKNAIPGQDVAGQVEVVGRDVTRFQPGDEVFGQLGAWRGGFAEYACFSEDEIVRKPTDVSFEQAAAVPDSGMTALQGLREGGLEADQKVLINGAAGGVGTFAVQIARSMGAHVTAVCSTGNVERVRSIGADEVIDYTRADFTRGGQRYDLMLDLVGNHALLACRRLLTPEGVYVATAAPAGNWTAPLMHPIKLMIVSMLGRQRMVPFMVKPNRDDLIVLQGLLERGEITPVLGRHYTLRQVPEALRHQGEGHARGKSIITL